MDNNYICPRCNYKTLAKPHMRDHFYTRKKVCIDRNDLVLTSEIKEIVLENHIYHRPQKTTTTTTTTATATTIINNYNTLNSMIVKLDTTDKLDKLLQYTGKRLIGFDDHAEEIFKADIEKMKKDLPKVTYNLDEQRICQLFDGLTRIKPKEFDTINSFVDKKTNRINLYLYKEWDSYLMADGIDRIMEIMNSTYFSEYELYLIKRIYNKDTDAFTVNESRNYLENFYSFIGIFNLTPDIKGMTDDHLVGHEIKEYNPYYISEECARIYSIQKEKLTKTRINEVKRKFVDIVKNNTSYNTDQINKEVINIMQADEKFKYLIVEALNGTSQMSI